MSSVVKPLVGGVSQSSPNKGNQEVTDYTYDLTNPQMNFGQVSNLSKPGGVDT